MDMENFHLKPMTIAIGVAVGAFILFAGKGGGTNPNAANSQLGLASQQIATSADLSYSHDQTTQALKALDITLGIASLRASLTGQDMNARAAQQIAAVNGMNSIVMSSMQADVMNKQIAAGVTTNLARNNTMITLARDQQDFALKAQPGQVALTQNLAQISADTTKTIATINSQTMMQLAQINANTQQQRMLSNLVQGAGGIPGVISSIGSIAGLFGGGGGVSDLFAGAADSGLMDAAALAFI